MIELNAVVKHYPNHDALRGVSLSIDRREFCFITGHSGAGKSTLLRLIALLETPTHGQIMISGRNVDRLSARERLEMRRAIGVTSQNPKLLLQDSCYQNVVMPLLVAGFKGKELAKRTRAALDMVGLLGKEKVKAVSLSCGEQQRLGVARAIVRKPTILLADEPTGNLDPDLSQEILALFERLNQFGVTVIIASHDTHLIQEVTHRVITLKEGLISTTTEESEV